MSFAAYRSTHIKTPVSRTIVIADSAGSGETEETKCRNEFDHCRDSNSEFTHSLRFRMTHSLSLWMISTGPVLWGSPCVHPLVEVLDDIHRASCVGVLPAFRAGGGESIHAVRRVHPLPSARRQTHASTPEAFAGTYIRLLFKEV